MPRSFSILGEWSDVGFGLSGDTVLATPMGWLRAADLAAGDLLRRPKGAPIAICAIEPAKAQSWLRFPTMSLGNRRDFVLGQGQGVLLKSDYIQNLTGEAAVTVPAQALMGWRGIHACAPPVVSLSLRLERPDLVLVGAGAHLVCQGINPIGWEGLAPVPSLSLASAQQLLACLIAQDAGFALRNLRPEATVF